MRSIQKTSKKAKTLLLIIAGIFVVGVGYFSFAYTTMGAWPFKKNSSLETTSSSSIDYSPPTQQEIESSQDAKKNNNTQTDNSSSEVKSSTEKTVSVGIAFAGYDPDEKAVDVRAFTPDVIEGTGTCTATFTKDGKSIIQTSKAFIDSTSSQCEPILVPTTRFDTKGSWNLSVTYTSGTSSGKSPSMKVEVNQ